MNNGRTYYADDETIAHIAKLEAENARLREQVERLRTLIAGWSLRLLWADGLDPCVEEMREEAGR